MSWDIRIAGDVAVVTMNSNKVNAQNDAVFADLHEAFDRLDREPPAAGVVLTAEGSTFSAGIDLKFALPLFASRDLEAVRAFFARYRTTNMRLFTYPKPMVAAINGHAFAGGVITALCCDYRLAGESEARFGLKEVPIGIPMPAVYVEIIRYALGTSNATVATLFGDVYGVRDAVRLGFVHEAVPPDRLLDAATERARAVPADAMAAFAFAKRALQAPALANIERLADPLDRQRQHASAERQARTADRARAGRGRRLSTAFSCKTGAATQRRESSAAGGERNCGERQPGPGPSCLREPARAHRELLLSLDRLQGCCKHGVAGVPEFRAFRDCRRRRQDARRDTEAGAARLGRRLSKFPRSACVDASSQGSHNAWLSSSAAVRGPDDAIVVR
jgi:enoyl-CoA hydratase